MSGAPLGFCGILVTCFWNGKGEQEQGSQLELNLLCRILLWPGITLARIQLSCRVAGSLHMTCKVLLAAFHAVSDAPDASSLVQ